MAEYKIGETFEQMAYEEMASSQTGVALVTFLTVTLTYCPNLTVTLTL